MLGRPVALAVLAMSLAATSARGDTVKLTVKEVAGDVTVISGAQSQRATVGFMFAAPAEVRTGQDGSVLLADSVTTLRVSPNTVIDIPASAQPSGFLDRILQRSGSVLYNVNSRNGRPFAVETALLTSVVKGTLFSINVQEQSATVALLEGSLDVSGPGLTEHVLLAPGDAARRAAGERNISVERHTTAAAERAPARAARNSSLPDELLESRGIDGATEDLARVTAAIGLAPPSEAPVAPPNVTPPASTPPGGTPGGGAGSTPPPSDSTPVVTQPPGTPPPDTAPPTTTPPVTTPPATTPPVTEPPETAPPPATSAPVDDDDGSTGSRKGRARGHEQGHGKGNDERDSR